MYNPQLETFIHVADVGSFNKAAEEMYITPPAVIKQINLLENELGLKLFVRTHRGLRLTEEGASLYQDAKYVISYCKESVHRAKLAGRKNDNIIRIGTSPMTPGAFLSDLWPKIQKICPGIRFELIPYENTPENAREILKNLGKNIDIVAGPFDQAFLESRSCQAIELSKEPIRCALSINHPLADKELLTVQDLYGENFMLIRRNWNSYLDMMRDDLWQEHPQIHIIDFDFLSVDVFNQCEYNNNVIMTIDYWHDIHPMLRVLPVDWPYTIPFGIMHSPYPSTTVEHFLEAVQSVLHLN